MARYYYNTENFEMVCVCGVECEFYDVRIERSSVPQGLYHYEVAGDDDSGGDPVRGAKGILVNFFGTLISRTELPLDEEGKLICSLTCKCRPVKLPIMRTGKLQGL